jgi:hypothetical protein
MRTEKLDPEARSNAAPPERETQEETNGRARKERETKDDGRYIIFYDFEDAEGGED